VLAAIATLAAVVAPAVAARGGKPATKARHVVPIVAVSLARGTPLRVPSSFFGLSTEYTSLPSYMVQPSTFERVLSRLEVRDGGPLLLRIGGDSADVTYWNPGTFPLPPNADVLTDAWFRSTASLVSALRLHVIFDLNLRHSTPHLSAGLARAALSYMPAGSVVGFEIGNEPDLYGGYAIGDYVRDFQTYTAALAGVGPTLPRIGPASGDAHKGFIWLRGVITGARPSLGMASAHRYGLNACYPRNSGYYPTIKRVLSDREAARVVRPVKPAVRFAHQAKLVFRLDEFNSVTCGGLAGVSNTFATALWAPDALFRLLHTGLDGVNIHIRPDKINAPFVVTTSGLTVRPLLYGLILFARTLGPGAELMPLKLRAQHGGTLDAWAVRVRRHQLHLLLVNKQRTPLNAVLRMRARGVATVERLRARSPRATSGVTLGGQQLGSSATWTGKRKLERVRQTAGQFTLKMPAASAALVILTLR
jgi:hypothetical protein